MEVIDYEPVNLTDHIFCKVYHSDRIYQEKGQLMIYDKSGIRLVPPTPHADWHNSYEFNVVIHGKLFCKINEQLFEAQDGDFIFVNPNEIHKSWQESSDYLGFAVLVPVEQVMTYLYVSDSSSPVLLFDLNHNPLIRQRVWHHLMSIYELSLENLISTTIGINAAILSIFSVFLQEASYSLGKNKNYDADETPNPDSIFTEYLKMNYLEKISLETTAKHFGFSAVYFSKLFYKKVHINFSVYLNSLRLSHATHLLENTDDSISNIALQSGFPNVRSFVNAFQKINNLTPQQYRKRHLTS